MQKPFIAPGLFWRDDAGVTSIEYATMGALIAIVVIVTVMGIPVPLNVWFSAIAECLTHPTTCGAH